MITENLSTLKIHKLTQEQYDRESAAGNLDENALYLIPEDTFHTHTVANISDLTATATELNYMDGVTSNVQTQLDKKIDIDYITSGEMVVAKAEQDSDGEVIKDAYAKKADLQNGNIEVAKAMKATQDSSGNKIEDTYTKKANLTDGTVTVKNSTYATNATNDADGNEIKVTYRKVADARKYTNLSQQIYDASNPIAPKVEITDFMPTGKTEDDVIGIGGSLSVVLDTDAPNLFYFDCFWNTSGNFGRTLAYSTSPSMYFLTLGIVVAAISETQTAIYLTDIPECFSLGDNTKKGVANITIKDVNIFYK